MEKKKQLFRRSKIDRSTFDVLEMDNPVYLADPYFTARPQSSMFARIKNIKASLREYFENNDKVQL